MTLIDSSGWLEYFFDGPVASDYEKHVQAPEVLVPTIVLYEVYKVLKSRLEAASVSRAMGHLASCRTVALDERIALAAAEASLTHGLSLADAVIYSTAQQHGATLVSSDGHFAGLPDVEYIPRPGA